MTLCLTGCQDPVEQLAGNYSYKISGSVIIKGDTTVLSDEMGAMSLVHLSADSALLTFNSLAGPAYTTTAKIDSSHIAVMPYERNLHHRLIDYAITASGEGTVYGQTLVITLQYADTVADLKADKLTLLCKKN